MVNIEFIWSKVLKKIRGSSIINSNIHSTSKVESGSHVVNSTMGAYSFCGYDCELLYCSIGKYCSIANRVQIGGAKHPLEWVGMSPVFYFGKDSISKKYTSFKREPEKRIVIGNDVWIGSCAIIKEGVTIGDGAVIGAGSIVTKDVQSYEIVAGNPARRIRFRFSEQIINELLNLQWWNFTEDKIQSLAKYIKEPELFIEKAKNY